MFSKTCEYAIRAMIYIAQKTKDGKKVGIKEIAKGIDSPEHFIAKILQDLSKKNLLKSTKGPNGGFFLGSRDLECSLAQIVTMVDGDEIFNGCGLGLRECSEVQPCPIHHQFKAIRKNILTMLQNATLNDFAEEQEKVLTFLKR